MLAAGSPYGSANEIFAIPAEQNQGLISESLYEQTLQLYQQDYFLSVYNLTQLPLLIPSDWQSPYFGAYAQRKESAIELHVLGGMMRTPFSTPAIMAATICHELGHVLGGTPRQTIPFAEWTSTEGQSDFFAAFSCLPVVFKKYPQYHPQVSVQSLDFCSNDIRCARIAQTGLDLIQFFQKYSYQEFKSVSLNQAEIPAKVLIRNQYPTDQCRLDTFKAAALCVKDNKLDCRPPACWLPEKEKYPTDN